MLLAPLGLQLPYRVVLGTAGVWRGPGVGTTHTFCSISVENSLQIKLIWVSQCHLSVSSLKDGCNVSKWVWQMENSTATAGFSFCKTNPGESVFGLPVSEHVELRRLACSSGSCYWTLFPASGLEWVSRIVSGSARSRWCPCSGSSSAGDQHVVLTPGRMRSASCRGALNKLDDDVWHSTSHSWRQGIYTHQIMWSMWSIEYIKERLIFVWE